VFKHKENNECDNQFHDQIIKILVTIFKLNELPKFVIKTTVTDDDNDDKTEVRYLDDMVHSELTRQQPVHLVHKNDMQHNAPR